MSTATSTKVGVYNGKKYRVLFAGQTKFGMRARLCWFSDESKSFWVDLSKVSISENPATYSGSLNEPKSMKWANEEATKATSYEDHAPKTKWIFGDEEGPEPAEVPVSFKPYKADPAVCECGNKKNPKFKVCYPCHMSAIHED